MQFRDEASRHSMDSPCGCRANRVAERGVQTVPGTCNPGVGLRGAMSLQKLTALRELMAGHSTSLAAYIVHTADAHNSEYISPADAHIEWLSGFTGSAGTAVVTTDKALVWTDEHYYTQFEKEVDVKMWTFMKRSLPETVSIEKWLINNLTAGSVVGVDPHTMTREEWTPLQIALSVAKFKLMAIDKNLVDQAGHKLNDPSPQRLQNDILYLPLQYTGKTAGQKIKELREKMVEKNASALVLTALDEVAYTLNLRGSDIPYNPVFFSYLLITPDSVTLFWQEGCIPESIVKCVSEEGVKIECKPYAQITEVLRNLAIDLSNNGDGQHSIWLSNAASEAIHRAVSGEALKKPLNLISEVSPVALAKLIKNDVELEGFRRCHVRDGIAVVRFFKWLHDQIDAGISITEIQAAERLLEYRKEEKDFMGSSFETIASAGENGAIIHYSPSVLSPREIRADDVFLLDSGGQYRDGTTDITRTRHMSNPTDYQKDTFTRVLKGQIGISTALFPVGVKGNVLDTLARKYLWDVGLDYPHGTSHGVGHFLIVKEEPTGISQVHYPQNPGLQSGQILSNEPGYYKAGEFGIRHEDLLETVLITKDSKHPRSSNLLGDYDGRGVLGFNILSLCPHQTKFLKIELLDEFELNFINSYHQRVLNTLGPILKERGLKEDFVWLEKECVPIKRAEKDFMGPSFETIASAGENGAIIHYSPSVLSPREIRADDVFLLDSGGQYRDGTTDITRTRHMSNPTDYQKDTFTRVLKGQIGISTALFPVGVKGNVLDTLARKYLWDVGLDYPHGTSHGVGHFLIVKEEPTGISQVHYPQNPGLQSGQILSNEPGYYKAGEFGIRHEDLLETVLITKDSKPRASNLFGDYDGRGVLGFNILSLCPHQIKFMKIELLDEFELNFINSYHQRVLNTLGPILKERGLKEDFEWLEKECGPIIRTFIIRHLLVQNVHT